MSGTTHGSDLPGQPGRLARAPATLWGRRGPCAAVLSSPSDPENAQAQEGSQGSSVLSLCDAADGPAQKPLCWPAGAPACPRAGSQVGVAMPCCFCLPPWFAGHEAVGTLRLRGGGAQLPSRAPPVGGEGKVGSGTSSSAQRALSPPGFSVLLLSFVCRR